MTRRNFNWYYDTSHELGLSHVVDDARDEQEFVSNHSTKGGAEYRAAMRERQQAKMGFMLANINA